MILWCWWQQCDSGVNVWIGMSSAECYCDLLWVKLLNDAKLLDDIVDT